MELSVKTERTPPVLDVEHSLNLQYLNHRDDREHVAQQVLRAASLVGLAPAASSVLAFYDIARRPQTHDTLARLAIFKKALCAKGTIVKVEAPGEKDCEGALVRRIVLSAPGRQDYSLELSTMTFHGNPHPHYGEGLLCFIARGPKGS
jgi:hypothetical protein